MEFTCVVKDVVNSHLPSVEIMDIDCGVMTVKMDIHKELNLVKKGDTFNMGIYKSLPYYVEGKDFLAHGYVITKRKSNDYANIYISLWGYLLVITTNEVNLIESLNPMDKVYVKLWK